MADVSSIRLLLKRVSRRLRAQRALEALSSMSILSGAWLIVAIFLLKVRHLGPENLALVLGLALLFPLTALLITLLRPIHPMIAAQVVDRRLGLKDRIGSAWDFLTRNEGEGLSPYARAQVDDAAQRAAGVKTREAFPLRFPRRFGVFALQLLLAGVLVMVPAFPEPRPAEAAAPPPEVDGMAVDFDELDGFNEFLNEVHQDAVNEELDEVAQAAEEFNELLQDLADQRLPYRDALDRIAALDQKLAREQWEPDPEAEQFLKQLGQDLKRSKITKEAGEALHENELRKAREAVRKSAEQVKREPPDPRRLEELRRAIERAAKRQPPDSEQRLKRLQQKQRRLKQKNQQKQQSRANKRRLRKNQRELERLRRNLEKHRQQQRQLQRLQRDMQQLAESLNLHGNEELQQMLDQLAEDINRMAREQQSEQQTRSLRQRLDELRRLLQQLQRSGKGFKVRLGRFNKGARGGKSRPMSGGGSGGKGGGKTITLTPGGRGGKGGLALRKRGGQGGSKGQNGDRPGGSKGQGIGNSHDPDMRGDGSKLKGRYTDVQVNPAQGEGPSRQQVIQTAADQGFATESYGKVHQTYERHAESVLEKQDIPPGYRRYIRLYFERIRPR